MASPPVSARHPRLLSCVFLLSLTSILVAGTAVRRGPYPTPRAGTQLHAGGEEEIEIDGDEEVEDGEGTTLVEWVETYEGALYEARLGGPVPRWVVLVVTDDSRWSAQLLAGLARSPEVARLARDHFVMAAVPEEDLPTYARLRFNAVRHRLRAHAMAPSHESGGWPSQLAPYAPSVFFIEPDGLPRADLVNRFAPEDQVRRRTLAGVPVRGAVITHRPRGVSAGSGVQVLLPQRNAARAHDGACSRDAHCSRRRRAG